MVQRKEHHERMTAQVKRGLMRQDRPQQSALSFDKMMLKVKNFSALKAEVLEQR